MARTTRSLRPRARPGGQALLAQNLPGREEFGGIVDNLLREARAAGVALHCGNELDANAIADLAPDTVILATGAGPYLPDLDIDQGSCVTYEQMLRGEGEIGNSVLVADWRADWIGIGIAEKLAAEGCRVRLCVNGYTPGQTIQQYVRDTSVGRLHKLGVEWISYLRLFGADGDSVYFQHTTSGEAVVCEGVDTLVTCLGHERVAELEAEVDGLGIERAQPREPFTNTLLEAAR